MADVIPANVAADAFRRAHGELADQNVLLRARITMLEAELEQARAGAASLSGPPSQEHASLHVPADAAG